MDHPLSITIRQHFASQSPGAIPGMPWDSQYWRTAPPIGPAEATSIPGQTASLQLPQRPRLISAPPRSRESPASPPILSRFITDRIARTGGRSSPPRRGRMPSVKRRLNHRPLRRHAPGWRSGDPKSPLDRRIGLGEQVVTTKTLPAVFPPPSALPPHASVHQRWPW